MSNVWDEETAAGHPSGDDALEHQALSNDINLNNTPTSSQEALEETLGPTKPLESVETACEEEFMHCVDDLMHLDVDDEMTEYTIDVACDAPFKVEEFTDATLGFMSNPKNKKSRKLHERHQKQHVNYCNQNPTRKPEMEACMCNYFSVTSMTDRCSPGNL